MPIRSLTSLSIAGLRQRPATFVLTATGVALGVALFLGVLVTIATVDRIFSAGARDLIGGAQVRVVPLGLAGSLIDESVIAGLEDAPSVDAVVTTFGFPSALDHPSTGRRVAATVTSTRSQMLLAGVDFEAAARLYRFELTSGRIPRPGADEVLLPARVASEMRTQVGEDLVVSTPTGPWTARLSGVLHDAVGGSFFFGQVVYAPIDRARALAEQPGGVSLVSIGLAAGTDPSDWIRQHRSLLGPGVELEDATALLGELRGAMGALGVAFGAMAAMVVFVAAYLIHLTLSTAVAERWRLHGTLRALGASRRAIRRIVVVEALVLGGVATAVGLAAGLGVAAAMVAVMSQFFGLGDIRLVVPAAALIAAAGLGMAGSLVSALIPATRAARTDPVVAIREAEALTRSTSGRQDVGVVAAVAGVGLAVFVQTRLALWISTLLVLSGSVAIARVALPPLARVVGGIARQISRGTGAVAVHHISSDRRRSASILALVMVGVAMSATIVSALDSMTSAFDRQVDKQYGADVQLTAGSSFDNSFVAAVRTVPGVHAVAPVRSGQARLELDRGQQSAQLSVIHPDSWFEVAGFAWADGDERTASEALRRGGAVLLPEGMANRIGVRRGSKVTVVTAASARELEVAGIYASFLFGSRTRLYAGIVDAQALGGGDPTELHVAVTPGSRPDAVADEILDRLGGLDVFSAQSAEVVKNELRRQFDGFFAPSWAILAVVVIVSVLGLANTLAISVLHRVREVGMLRAIGTQRRRVGAMFLVESITLVGAAFVLAVPLGALLSWLVLRTATIMLDLSVSFRYPWTALVVAGLVAAIVGSVAAIAPARRAARLDPVAALRFE